MKEKEQLVEQGKPLTYHLDGGGSLYKAFCPELDVACYGETPESAVDDLFKLAKAEIKGIISRRGIFPSRVDERRPLAESLGGVDDISSVFERVAGPAPERSGLKYPQHTFKYKKDK